MILRISQLDLCIGTITPVRLMSHLFWCEFSSLVVSYASDNSTFIPPGDNYWRIDRSKMELLVCLTLLYMIIKENWITDLWSWVHALSTQQDAESFGNFFFNIHLFYIAYKKRTRPISTPHDGRRWWGLNLHTSACESPTLPLCYGRRQCRLICSCLVQVWLRQKYSIPQVQQVWGSNP